MVFGGLGLGNSKPLTKRTWFFAGKCVRDRLGEASLFRVTDDHVHPCVSLDPRRRATNEIEAAQDCE